MSDDINEQLAELERLEQEEAKQKREAEIAKKLARLGLKKASASKYGGEEGKAFNIVETPAGFFVVHKVAGVVAKNFRKSEMSDADAEEFVKAHLEKEDHERFEKAITDFDFLLSSDFLVGCANLHGAKLGDRSKK